MLRPQLILLAYWLVMIVLSAFFLRLACSLCQTDIPTWRRAIISTVIVTFLAYLTFDFTGYLIMRSLGDVVLRVPPWYGYNFWFYEPIGLKWAIISIAGPLKYLPFVFALCAAGVLQVIVLQAQVTFRFGLLIFVLQWIATIVAGYIVALVLGGVLSALGWSLQPAPEATPPEQVQRQTPPRQAAAPRGRSAAASRKKSRSPRVETPPGAQAGGDKSDSEPTRLQIIGQQIEGAAQAPREYAQRAGENLKEYAESHLDELKEDLAPVVERLPEPVQNFLDKGGWWVVIGAFVVVVLLWLRAMMRRLFGASKPKRRKKKKGMKKVKANLRENLSLLGEALTEEGSQRLTVKGVPARLRLVILSLGSRNAGELSEEMADRVLDWIKPGLAEVTSVDYPRVRVWPPFYSLDGFATAFASNVPIPEPKGEKSRWVLVTGQAKMGQALIHVGLALYADEANTLRDLKVKGEKWLGVLGVKEAQQLVGAR